MKLQVIRTQFGQDATNGMLFVDGLFECYTLEDQYQEVKVMHETCIPEGTYDIKFRTVGGFHSRYTERYGAMHKGMLWLQDVPGFEYILIHTKLYNKVAKQLLIGNPVTIEYSKINLKNNIQIGDSNVSQIDDIKELVEEKMSDINGNLIKINAKIGGRIIS